jgi:hypothetical protein
MTVDFDGYSHCALGWVGRAAQVTQSDHYDQLRGTASVLE